MMTLHRSIETLEAPQVDVFNGDASDTVDWLRLPENMKKYEKEVKSLIKAFDLTPMVLSHDTIMAIARDVRSFHSDIVECTQLDDYKPEIDIKLSWLDRAVEHYEQLSIEW